MEDPKNPISKLVASFDAMSAATRNLAMQMTLFHSHVVDADCHARLEADPVWWEEVQAQTADVMAKAAKLP